ncbi:iron-containing redox enzyme family protein [Aetokthonos hydrillicola Thurmond2011]|jgi:pyrroloquinoline quinone (PQQ) biosynthesis protein C|uniref:Iron-containing redox enzyme family protein n=1 Tax=Aetokthonos hydrillicola Thurmond2011 TaxID=2712845 RepID=A0AAP5I8H9_9CYAN|nr:iron-containing redox enzyme family protein [Aetokthonos hydrillicola]MBO3460027.1 iron-containing redox enzyme family protein [Aetokthonos hydrillicola CCALA 1050]MBW4584624.1 iron-containing redox enzyme family protein [Aetokthonos hydrillicola CCALA 1050]MDR9895168.1 iron-containing redox enzyme family protein [Aetokthonos hydrillicola Thurmond2011]
MLATSYQLEQLNHLKDNHQFWKNSLLQAAQSGNLTIENYRYIWSQYLLYSQNFTRYIAGVMVACENDYHRALLSENLWEEGGGCKTEERHSEIFRKFLQQLGINPLKIEYADFTHKFVRQYLVETSCSDALWSSAFLSLGTESIVPQMYSIFIQGMLKAGIPDEWLHFFYTHVKCDDQHAATLAEIMCSFNQEIGWFDRCASALDKALTMRSDFFENLYAICLQQTNR